MQNISQAPSSHHIRNIAKDIILSILTFYVYNIYVQYVQIQAVNDMLKETRYSFLRWFLLTLVTFGIYHIYHEYRMTKDLGELNGEGVTNEPIIAIVLSLFGMSLVVDAIQQSQINKYYGSSQM